LTLSFLTSCSGDIDINNLEAREHGLRYIKETNTLADGKVVRKIGGKVSESNNYKDGKMIGNWFQYGDKGEVVSHGFGTEIKKYEKSLNNFDLTYCILSIVEIKKDFGYATLYMDNPILFTDKEKIVRLAKEILSDYSDKYKIDNLLIFDNNHEYSVSKSATMGNNQSYDTIPNSTIKKIHIH